MRHLLLSDVRESPNQIARARGDALFVEVLWLHTYEGTEMTSLIYSTPPFSPRGASMFSLRAEMLSSCRGENGGRKAKSARLVKTVKCVM